MGRNFGLWFLLWRRPVQSCICLVAPLIAVFAQFASAYYYGGSLLYPAGFALIVLTGASLATRHHLAEIRLVLLSEQCGLE